MKFNLKVFKNSRNGQAVVHLPKKYLANIPDKIKVDIPKNILRMKLPKEEYLW